MILALASLALHAAGAQDPTIQIVSAEPKKGYLMTVGSYEATLQVTPLLKARAEERCGKLQVRFGKFNYDNTILPNGTRMIVNYTQRFECIDPATDPYKPVAADWKPSETDKADANAFANRFLTTIDKGDAARGMPMMEPSLEITNAEWMDTTDRLREHSTLGGTWSIERAIWLNNPDGVSHPGAYVFVVVNGTYPKLAAYCGYLLLYREGPGRYWVAQRNVKVIPQNWVDDGSIAAGKIPEICNS